MAKLGKIGFGTATPRYAGNGSRLGITAKSVHIDPIVDPRTGFKDYDTWIERCFVEADGYQALCHSCHELKSNEEKAIAKARRKK